MHAAGALPPATVVATVMSNLGLERALEREGIAMRRAAVGDRYVLEQPAHVIFMEHAPTGDGRQTALLLSRPLRTGAEDPESPRMRVPRYRQLLESIPALEKRQLSMHPVLGPAITAAERELGSDGRVVVR